MLKLVVADSWEQICKLARNLALWGFRGQSDRWWHLESSIERKAADYGYPRSLLHFAERMMLREFQRRAHHYVSAPPETEQLVEWLAFIQHHGGVTRLLDFTYSFYVAAFFAIESAKQDAAVWAVNLTRLERAINEKTGKGTPKDPRRDVNNRHVAMAEYFLREGKRSLLVMNLEPERLNERLSIQQGLFLFTCDLTVPFEKALAELFNLKNDTFDEKNAESISIDEIQLAELLVLTDVLKIVIPRSLHKGALNDLKKMNVTSATLFPGLDGFARSMNCYLRVFDEDSEFFDRMRFKKPDAQPLAASDGDSRESEQ